jgi:ADP-ribosylglycohydrolase
MNDNEPIFELTMNTLQDRIRGSLMGGAIGDALGYPVEFLYTT